MNRNISLLIVVLLVLLVTSAYAQVTYKSGNCPLKNTVSNCGTRCMSDSQCPLNQKCCTNKCGYTSCAEPSVVSTGSGYKGSNQQAVYCNGVKCNTNEKCLFDRNIRREKCTRA
ncbi:PREDICTED: waprin-Thr1-like [Dinoponera quadriceps]|uniref:Waprin-Thr1-like n=1 Tax=Dinoponera quadriceps TaxID=609295 RepID=A0A6P3YCP8_DINQU|nr:PREDICTED: waprin-Thr1-like [Dinoponera quadriceps]